jgi:peptidoglycan L-alanyl-D-glutamate endopeptidase CwlK
MADAMKLAAEQLDIPLEWGGDWISFQDGPHFQLPRKQYK